MAERVVGPDTPMPHGYGFLKKGYAYKTALCRRETHQAGKTLYVVKDKSTTLGLRAPKWILAKVHQTEKVTRDDRREAVTKRDDHERERFEQAVQEQYPRIPGDDAAQIAQWAMRKRSGRVGRTSTLPLEKKAHLAAVAHARHRHTDYDRLVKEVGRDQARRAVSAGLSQVLQQWKDSSGLEHDPIVLEDSSSDESDLEEVEAQMEKTSITPRKSPQKRPMRRSKARPKVRRHSLGRRRSFTQRRA